MPHSNAEGIDPKKPKIFGMVCNGHCLCAICMLPMKMLLMFPGICTYNPISLEFDLKEFCTVEPVSGVVFKRFSADGLRYRFTHHTGGVPNSFNVFPAFNGNCSLSTISNGINIRYIGLQVFVYENSA